MVCTNGQLKGHIRKLQLKLVFVIVMEIYAKRIIDAQKMFS